VQGTAEKGTFDRNEFSQMLDLAEVGFKNLFQIQNQYLKEWGLL
jgi:ribonuclease PH